MSFRKNTILVLTVTLVAMMIVGGIPNTSRFLEVTHSDNTDVQNEGIVIEGVRQYTLSAESSEYPDYSSTPTYGTHTNEPSDGMGEDSGGSAGARTNLTEETVTYNQWNTKKYQSSFSSLPSDWKSLEIAYSGGYFQESGIGGFYGGFMNCSSVDTSGSNMVRFSLDIGGTWGTDEVSIQFWDGSNWDTMGACSTGAITTQTWTSSDSQYQISDFQVKLVFGLFSGSQSFQANEWLIEAQYEQNYGAFSAVYRFDTVDYSTYSIEELHVNYSTGFSSSESLWYLFEVDDITPDNIVRNSDGETDFSVDIHSLVTGDTCYIEIRDTDRSDSDPTSSWYIDRLYILLTEPEPVWDDIPGDKFLEYTQPLSYQMNATLLPTTDNWWVNDTGNFAIDSNGLITNASILPIGDYGVQVSANDTWGRTISEDFMITVQDTTSPIWTPPIVNQEEEYGSSFQYILGAYDLAGIKSWNLNDSVNFHMDNGIITNNSVLETGYYWLNVTVMDNNDNSLSEIFSVFINDTVDPVWEFTPVNQFREYGLDFVYDLDATDLAGIIWHINDTSNFDIDNEGVIRNKTALSVRTYGLLVIVEDSHGNTISASFDLLVNDTVDPEWISDPANQFREYGNQFIYDLDSFDIAGINTWLISDTQNFTIDSSGVVSNKTFLAVGNYSLQVTAIDAHGNYLFGYFILEVEDTTPPNWDVVPPIQELAYREQLSLQLYASDIAGIVQWMVNDTDTFNIDGSGFLTSLGNLEDGWYYVEVTAVDAHGVNSSLVISIFVALSTTTTPDPGLTMLLTIGGIALGAVVLFASLRTWRAVQRDRLKQIEDGKGEVDTALDYLESIKPDLEGKDEDTQVGELSIEPFVCLIPGNT